MAIGVAVRVRAGAMGGAERGGEGWWDEATEGREVAVRWCSGNGRREGTNVRNGTGKLPGGDEGSEGAWRVATSHRRGRR